MAGSAANVLTESDYGSDGVDSTINEGLGAPLLRGDLTDLPPAAPRGPVHQRQIQQEPFQIIETDDNFQPLGGDYRESSLADDPTNGTLLERREQEAHEQRELSARQQRRQAQKQGRDRTLSENEQLKRQLDDLKAQQNEFLQRFGHIEPRLLQIDKSRLQDQYQNLESQITRAADRAAAIDRQFAEAVATGDGETISKLLVERDTVRDEGTQLVAQKNQLAQQLQATPDYNQAFYQPAPAASPVADRYINNFVAQNPWYDPKDPRNIDSQVILTIDRAVAAEGYRPDTQDYWDQIQLRAAEYLPHRFDSQPAPAPRRQPMQQQRQPADPVRRGPQVAGGNERLQAAPAAPGNNQFYLSPQRKQALQELGALDRNGRVADQAKFERYARGYMKYDRENPGVEF